MSYAGPPPTTPPPPGWRPQLVFRPDPPRELPPVDHRRLDADEERARRFTWLLGAAAAAVALLVGCALLARLAT